MMKKGGFSPEQAGAVEAVAATGGQIMPPVMGVVAFLMAEFLQVPYTTVATAAIIPALMFYGAFFLYVDLIAARNGIRPAVSGHSRPALQVLYSGWPCLVPFAVLVAASKTTTTAFESRLDQSVTKIVLLSFDTEQNPRPSEVTTDVTSMLVMSPVAASITSTERPLA
jgi:TRAP-type uncharacterized transport system fused permease subunit